VPLLPRTIAEQVAGLVAEHNTLDSVEVAYAQPPAEPADEGDRNPMSASAQNIQVYIFEDRFFVPDVGRTMEEVNVDIEPVRAVAAVDAAGLAGALQAAIERGNPRIPTPNRNTYEPIIIKASGAKNWRDFEKRALCFMITRYPERFEVVPSKRARGGKWDFNHSNIGTLPSEVGAKGLAAWLVEYVKSVGIVASS
jgi:hypothetical protein